MLKFLFLLCILSISHVLFIKPSQTNLIKKLSLFYSGIIFLFSLYLWVSFDTLTSYLQFVYVLDWIPIYNYNVVFGVDGLSLFFIILTTLLIFLCILGSWDSVQHSIKEYFLCFLTLNLLLILVFCVRDVFLF
jgi:NADH-quinone oxidoreductase subunit M